MQRLISSASGIMLFIVLVYMLESFLSTFLFLNRLEFEKHEERKLGLMEWNIMSGNRNSIRERKYRYDARDRNIHVGKGNRANRCSTREDILRRPQLYHWIVIPLNNSTGSCCRNTVDVNVKPLLEYQTVQFFVIPTKCPISTLYLPYEWLMISEQYLLVFRNTIG